MFNNGSHLWGTYGCIFELFLKEQLNITGKVLVMFPAATDMRQVTKTSDFGFISVFKTQGWSWKVMAIRN